MGGQPCCNSISQSYKTHCKASLVQSFCGKYDIAFAGWTDYSQSLRERRPYRSSLALNLAESKRSRIMTLAST
jgi:hypothetical protein